ncbi:MAG: hypothetical protein ACYC46_07320 [Acidobacteriaceae bacterium]
MAPFAMGQSTGFASHFSKLDATFSAIANFTKSSSGNGIKQSASGASGGMMTIRYTRSAWFGLEGNYKLTRVTEHYENVPFTQFPAPASFAAQTNVNELTFGYVAHGPQFRNLTPFAGAGVGTTIFKPTYKGGLSLPTQARMTSYVTAGVDDPVFNSHIGLRFQVRGLFFKAPDFGTDYLVTNSRTMSWEPAIGIYFHF